MMKIDVNKLKEIPHGISSSFGLCQYGSALNKDLQEWAEHHELFVEPSGLFTNVYLQRAGKFSKPLDEMFNAPTVFEYMDGFSPNLNKHLHVGHLSNLVMAKAFKGLGVAKSTVAILGDTLSGDVNKEDALSMFEWYCKTFDYVVDKVCFASEQVVSEDALVDGEDEYSGTKVLSVGDKKVVIKKSDGSTTYFAQDIAFASNIVKGNCLYITGSEQNPHFAMLKEIYPNIQHIGLGLVSVKGGKMSSRIGNVITAKDMIDFLFEQFGDYKVVYNVLAGFFIKSAPSTTKNVDMEYMSNPLNSQGLYLSYTLAKLKSAGLSCSPGVEFHSIPLAFKSFKAKFTLSPNVLFEELYLHANNISNLYIDHKIVGNPENQAMFEKLGSDLALGMKMLGLFEVEKV